MEVYISSKVYWRLCCKRDRRCGFKFPASRYLWMCIREKDLLNIPRYDWREAFSKTSLTLESIAVGSNFCMPADVRKKIAEARQKLLDENTLEVEPCGLTTADMLAMMIYLIATE